MPEQPDTRDQIDYADLHSERVFLENLLQQRFNFFIVAFSLIVAAGTSAGSMSELNLVLVVGLLLSGMLGVCVYRVFVKVDAALVLLHGFADKPMHRVAEAATKKWRLSVRANDLMGYVIPIFALVTIVVWGVLANFEVITVK